MNVRVYKNADAIGAAAASLFAAQVISKPNCVLGLATGSTPLPTYRRMAALYEEGAVDYSGVTTYNLDEYVGLDHDHDQSYYYFMHDNLFKYINIPEEQIHVLSGMAADPAEECKAYDAAIDAAGGIDLQILGIGHNGHIGFNEPREDDFVYGTNIVTLTQSTRDANAQYFDKPEDMPEKAISMGVGTIMTAKRVILLATGKGKAQAILDTVKGPVTSKCPASILQLHPNCQIIVDEEAASLL